jgi:Putative metallopeptidase
LPIGWVEKNMRRSTAVVAFATWIIAQALPVSAQAPALQPNPQIQVDYIRPKNSSPASDPTQYNRYMAIYEWLRIRRPLDEIQKFLAPLRLPRSIKIEVDTCGAERRPYVAANPVTGAAASPVTICYELIDKIENIAAGVKGNDPLKQMVIVGTFTQAVLHELAYAVFDVLQVPVWGREDDAADRLAAFVLLQFSGEIAHATMVGSAEFFLLSLRTWTGSAFADTTSPEGQRFYNFLCIAYGGDSNDFGGWTEAPEGQDPLLPDRRARQCSHEYHQVRAAFNLRIMPYIDPDLLLQIKAAQWFHPGELSK